MRDYTSKRFAVAGERKLGDSVGHFLRAVSAVIAAAAVTAVVVRVVRRYVRNSGEHAVLLEWENFEPPQESIADAENRLMAAIESVPGVGEVDGNEVGGGGATIYLYGRDCERLWGAIETTVRALDPAPTRVLLRLGGPDVNGRELTL